MLIQFGNQQIETSNVATIQTYITKHVRNESPKIILIVVGIISSILVLPLFIFSSLQIFGLGLEIIFGTLILIGLLLKVYKWNTYHIRISLNSGEMFDLSHCNQEIIQNIYDSLTSGRI